MSATISQGSIGFSAAHLGDRAAVQPAVLPMTGSVAAFPTVAALYVESGGCYFDIPGVDAWDVVRDARQYAGPHPVVAHPPCDRWHMLSAVNHKRWGFVINDDGGVFAAALEAVRTWGGVLEHPAQTRAYRFHGIPQPKSRGWQRTFDGDWITEVDQAAYGHRAKKSTWLLYHGETPPPMLDWRDTPGTYQVGNFDQKLPVMGNLEARLTPEPFRDLLLSIARTAKVSAPRHTPKNEAV